MIRESNNVSLLESIINFSDDAIISKQLDGTITSWNKAAEKIFGYTAKEIIGQPISVLIPPDLIFEEREIMKKINAGNYVEHYETERVKKDGTIINISLSVSPIKNNEGVIIGASKIARDISERRQTDSTLSRSLKEIKDYKYALDESSIVAITDQKGIIKYVNDNFCKISQYNREELLGQDHRIINSGYHDAGFIRNLWVTIANGQIWKGEIKNKAKDGSYYWVDTTIVPFLNDEEKPYQYVAIRSDITYRKKAEEQNVYTQHRYQQVVENILDGLMIDDPNGKVLYANDQFLKLFGLETTDLKNLVLEDYVSPRFREILRDRHNRRVAGEEVPATFEYEGLRKDGTRIWLEVRVCKVLENGKVIGTQSAIRDISDRKKTEEDIIKLNQSLEHIVSERTASLEAANKELESFSYSVAHDLRAPLRIINGYSDILKNDYKDKLDADGHRLINIIVNNTHRMGKLIDELLNLARLGRKELTKHNTDMNALVQIVISEQMAIADKPIQFNIKTLLPIVCDSTLIRQVWSNLISNAIKYSGKRDNQCIEISATQKDSHIVYSVKDNGVGFDMQYAHKLFGVFQRLHKQTEYEGTGVGLALVQRIIIKHGGLVWADAEVDKGATFNFSLPIIDHIN